MADRSPNPSFDPRATPPDDEVECLIHDAEALTAEIVGLVDPTPETGPAPAGAPLSVGGDPVEAAEAVSQQVLQLDDILGGGDFETIAQDEAIDASRSSDGDVPRRPVAARSEGAIDAVSGDGDCPGHDETADSAVRAPSREAVPLETGILSRAIRRRVEVEALTTPISDAPSGECENESPVSPPLSDRFNRAARGAVRSTVGLARDVGCSVPNAFLRVVVLLDAPFRGVPAAVKRHVGTVALITLIMGLAALVLPVALDGGPDHDVGAQTQPARQ